MFIKTAFSVAFLQIRCALLSPKSWVALFIGLLIGATAGLEYVQTAKQLGYPLQFVEPFLILITDRVMRVFTVVGVALLLSDAPFSNMNTPYLVFRTRRRVWMSGNTIYMFIACCAYLLMIMFASALVSMSYSYIQNQWSPLARLLVMDQQDYQLRSNRYISSIIMQRMSPYHACIWQSALLMMYSFCVSGLMLFINTVQKRSAGFAIAMLFHGLMLVMYLDGHPIGLKISLFTHASLADHMGSTISLGTSVLLFFAFAFCTYGLAIRSARKMDI